MLRFTVFSSLVAGGFLLALAIPTPAKAGEPANAGAANHVILVHHTKKRWKKRYKRRYHSQRRSRRYVRRRDSLDHLVVYPHTRVDLGTNF